MTLELQRKGLFFIYTEAKDRFCLEPLVRSLREREWVVTEIQPIDDVCADRYEGLDAFGSAPFPTIVAATAYALVIARQIRSGPFRSIGFEHGVAPFKKYTFGAHFCDFDAYLAPSVLWADRLRRLYPEHANRFRVGGYPRLDDLRLRVHAECMLARRDVYKLTSSDKLKLVAFSWGVDSAALERMPDRQDVVYLFHPAEERSIFEGRWQHAHAFRSTPSVASELLGIADIVVGDISSLTLEAVALGLPVMMAVDRALYKPGYDVDDAFLDPASADYLLVPHSDTRLSGKGVLSLEGLLTLLECDDLMVDTTAATVVLRGSDTETPKLMALLEVQPSLLPPTGDNMALARTAIETFLEEAAAFIETEAGPSAANQNFLQDFGFVSFCYRNILMRDPDPEGVETYTTLLARSDRTGVGRRLTLFQVMHSLASSDEAHSHVGRPGRAGPLARVLSAP